MENVKTKVDNATQATEGMDDVPEGGGSVSPYRTLLGNREFLLFKFRTYSGGIGYSVYLVTILWLAYRLSGNVLLPGIVVGVEAGVYTLTFLIGPLVDGIKDKRSVFLICYPIQAAAALLLGVSYLGGFLNIPLLLGLVVVLAILWDFSWAADATVARLLFHQDDLFRISGLSSVIGGPLSIVGYLSAGAILVFLGPAGGAFLYAALLAAAAVLAVPLPIPSPRSVRGKYLSGFMGGWSYFRGERGKPLRHLGILQSVYGFFAIVPPLLITLFASQLLGGAVSAYAELYVMYLIGGIVAGFVIGHLNPRKKVGLLLLSALLLTGVFLFAAALVVFSLLLSVAVWFAVGGFNSARIDVHWTYMQGAYPPEVLARINANSYLFTGISSTLGALAFGYLSVRLGPSSLDALAAFGFLLAAALGTALSGVRGLRF